MLTVRIGDGPAIAEAIGMKTPGNAKVPCRFCHIQATPIRTGNHTQHYIPHTQAQIDGDLIFRQDLRHEIDLAIDAGGTYPSIFGKLQNAFP